MTLSISIMKISFELRDGLNEKRRNIVKLLYHNVITTNLESFGIFFNFLEFFRQDSFEHDKKASIVLK
ncbi:MAG: hypothetical protein HQK89_16830 [Nitrospirae bacterium]|nr:hypothetical protein [Nitrospirota bacterium]